MNNQNYHPILKEPPIAHALHKWDEETRTLTYEYNGKNIITMIIPGNDEVGFRHGSDGNLQSMPFIQQIYVMIDNPVKAKVKFLLSKDAINMRPKRAASENAILGQVGTPLMYGVNGLYDVDQDLLIDWNGCKWSWSGSRLTVNEDGDLEAEILVELGPKPWFINLRMHYYKTHLGYKYHKPWEFKPKQEPVVGWCSWEAFRRDVTQENIDEVSEFFNEKLKDYGFKYIQLDDGYEIMPIPPGGKDTVADGWLKINSNFPRGHKGVVDSIKNNGFDAGIWTNCNITNTKFAENYAQDILKDNKGKPMLGEWIDYILDCRIETLKKHVAPYYKGLSEEGYTYFKTDAIRHLLLDALQEAVRQGIMTNEECEKKFRAFMECARENIGDDAYFLASWGVLSECIGLVDACRIAMDANPTWAGFRMQLVESARWFNTQRILFLNDPDHICARGKLEWVKSVASLTSLSGGLFMLSDPIEVYDDERIQIIKQNIPTLTTRAGETGPLDLEYPAFTWTKLHGFAVPREKPVSAEDITEEEALNMAGIYPTMKDKHPFSTLWAFHIDNSEKQWCVAGRFATVPLEKSTLKVEALGLDPSKKYLGFDFWKQKYLGEISEGLVCEKLELGNCQIIALRERTSHPQVIASTRHVSMDNVSIKSEVWKDGYLEVVVEGKEGTTESYFVHVGDKRFNNIEACNGEVKYFIEDEVIKIDVKFGKKVCILKILF